MHTTPHLLDVVALLSDVPAHGLLRGQVGTVVALLDGAYEVEFSDDEGETYAELALAPDQLLVLHPRPQRAAYGSKSRPKPSISRRVRASSTAIR